MAKLKMYQFMGSTENQKANEVTITRDPSVIKKRRTRPKNQDEESNVGKIGNDISNMSLSASLGKDERIFKMIVLFDKGELFTISSIAEKMNVSYATAKKYAKEANIKVFDNVSKKYTDGRLPDTVVSSNQNKGVN